MKRTTIAERATCAWFYCWIFVAALNAGLTSCTKKPKPAEPIHPPHEFSEASEDMLARAPSDQVFAGLEPSPRFPTVYFDYDSEALRPEFRDPLAAAVKASRARWSCAVDGHASEEGDAVYNLALGERRAEVVALYLELLGGITTIATSYGEERPVARLPDEQWKNRRVEVKCQ